MSLFQKLKQIFKRDRPALIFSGSGTGAWEAALTNTLSPGEKVLAPRFGQFSHLWIDLAQRIGLDVVVQDEEWGAGASPERIEEALRADRTHAIKGVLIVHNETATGVTSDIAAIRRAIDNAGHPAMLYVDGVSSIGSIDFDMDRWRVDLAVAGSQKGLMLPAGLGIVCASPKALAADKTAGCARTYFDFGDQMKANATGYFPYTPSLPMLYGLQESLGILFEEQLVHVFERHQVLADGVRAAVAWGLQLCAKEPKWYSNTISAIMVPPGVDGADVSTPRSAAITSRWAPASPRLRASFSASGIGRPERFHGAGRARRGGNGDARCRHRRDPGQRRGGGAVALSQHYHGEGEAADRAGTLRPDASRRRFPPAARRVMLTTGFRVS